MSEGGEEDTALAQPLLAPIDCLPPSASCGAVEALPLVHQQEQRPSSPRWQPPGTRYYEAYLHMAAWLGVLFVGYGVQCVASLLGLPDDGVHKADYFEIFSDATSIMLWGAVLGWFCGVTAPHRFRWLFNQRRWYAWACLLGTPPVYSAISNIHGMKHDLAHLGGWGAGFIVVWAAGMSAIAATIAWHISRVVRRRQPGDAAAYVASRFLVLAFFGGSAAVLLAQGTDMHLHHLYLGWALAFWAELNHPLSAVTLGIGTGIFLQGIGAYSFAPVFQERCFASPSASSFECSFEADSPFTVQICSVSGPMPRHSCH